MTLEAVRDAIDTCGEIDTAVFARRTRNAIALAIVSSGGRAAETRTPPVERLRESVGDDLGTVLAEVYEGGEDWTTHAIDALEPLNELAKR